MVTLHITDLIISWVSVVEVLIKCWSYSMGTYGQNSFEKMGKIMGLGLLVQMCLILLNPELNFRSSSAKVVNFELNFSSGMNFGNTIWDYNICGFHDFAFTNHTCNRNSWFLTSINYYDSSSQINYSAHLQWYRLNQFNHKKCDFCDFTYHIPP